MADRENGKPADAEGDSEEVHELGPFYNWLSISGALVAAVSLGAAIFLLLLPLVRRDPSGYGGLILILPVFVLLIGAAVVAVGLRRERQRRARGQGASISGHWVIDLNPFKQRREATALLATAVLGSLIVLSAGTVSLSGVQFTESNAFCGDVCHDVMHPEATVYENSPHAQIDCVECHVGHDTDSYVRAKLNGLRQIYDVATGNVNRPIPTPIRNQRPSREMCESCHWSNRMVDYKLLHNEYFRGNEESTPRAIQLMVKVGGGNGEMQMGSGIHYHMFSAQKVEFIARDRQRQDISWVRVTRDDGSATEFDNLENPLDDEEKEELEVRTMECLDCHNRPAHQFTAPIDSVNRALVAGELPRGLPYIKRESVRVLDGDYAATDAAMAGIDSGLRTFYQDNYPDLLQNGSEELARAVESLRAIYRNTIFPAMKADWSAHPSNIGHLDSPGCFRCHNYEMESEDGDTIFQDCATCHAVIAQIDAESEDGYEGDLDFDTGLPFLHPDGDEYMENQTLCSDCHDGGFKVYTKLD